MSYSLQNSITWSQSFIADLNPTVYTGSEPALTTANIIVSMMLNPPFTWPWNRQYAEATLTAGVQDYSVATEDFGFLEKAMISYTSGGTTFQNELEAVYNNQPLGTTSQQSRPQFVAVQLQGILATSPPAEGVVFRFVNSPDQTYNVTFVYQMAPNFFTEVTQDWNTQCGIPYSFIDVFNSLFLSEMFQFSDDPRAVQYRQRGMAALLAKSSGLSEAQKNEITSYSNSNDLQTLAAHLKVQSASQARNV